MTLKEKYDSACNEYTKKFAKKQGLYFDYWIADLVGDTACFNSDFFASMSEIKLDIDNDISKDAFLEWYEIEDNKKSYYGYLREKNLLDD